MLREGRLKHVNPFLRLALPFVLLFRLVVGQASGTATEKGSTSTSPKSPDTYFVPCDDQIKTNHVTGPVSAYGKWRAYVEVSVQSGCLYTTRLWVAKQGGAYRQVYLIPPERENTANGMKILGWAPGSRMMLVQTERSAIGTDAGLTEAVVAMDAKTGEVYQPDLSAVLQDRKPRCAFHVTGGGFDSDPNVVLLIRVKLFSFSEADETDIPAQERCTAGEETWSFNYANGEVKRVDNSTLLHVAVAKRTQP
jgi:hypothetical protein